METDLKNQRQWLYLLAFINLVIIVIMQLVGQALKPGGIIPFEFAGSAEKAQSMVMAWQRQGALPELFFLLGFDYLFMATYSSFLFLACLQCQSGLSKEGARFFLVLGWLQPGAALLDAIENYALYQSAMDNSGDLFPRLAYLCAAPKFLIVLAALLACSSAWLVKRFKSNP